MEHMKKYPIKEVWQLLGEENLMRKTRTGKKDVTIIVDGFDVYARSLRYMTFYQKGTKCVCCEREGAYFLLEQSDGNGKRRHFNLYTSDGVLMTKDHILPKSKGGIDHVDNMQPMCIVCNMQKGNKIAV